MKIFNLIVGFCLVAFSYAFAEENTEGGQNVGSTTDWEKLLEEVEVKAERVVHNGDHDIIYLTEQNRNFGASAVDAISSLPQFKTRLNAESITTINGQKVTILINGVIASGQRLMGCSGEEIAKIAYYEIAPPQYQIYTDGPVIDVTLRRPKKWHFTGYANLSNSIKLDNTAGNLSLSWADSANYISGNYGTLYNKTKNSLTRQAFSYDNQPGETYIGDKNKNRFCNNIASIDWYHFFRSSILYAGVGFTGNDIKDYNQSRSIESDNASNDDCTDRFANSICSSDRWHGTIYYWKKFKDYVTLSAQIEGSISESSASNALSLKHASANNFFESESSSDNRNRGLSAQMVFSWRTGKWADGSGMFSAGLSYIFSDMEMKLSDSRSGIYMNERRSRAYALYNASKGKFRAIASVYLFNNAYHLPYNQSRDYWALTPRLNLIYTPSPKSKIIWDNRLTREFPIMAEFYAVPEQIDTAYVEISNPSTKPYNIWASQLSGNIFLADNKLFVSPQIKFSRAFNPYTPSLEIRDGVVYNTTVETNHSSAWNFNLALTYSLLPWLSIQPQATYKHQNYSTLSQKVDWGRFSYGCNIIVSYRRHNLTLTAGSSNRYRSGDFYSYASPSYMASYMWTHKNLSLSASWSYMAVKTRSSASIPGFSTEIVSTLPSLKNRVTCSVSYRFSIGRNINHYTSRDTEDTEFDDGLKKRE